MMMNTFASDIQIVLKPQMDETGDNNEGNQGDEEQLADDVE